MKTFGKMKLNYFERIIFSGLGVISSLLNVLTSLMGNSPTCDLDGRYWKSKLDSIYVNRVSEVSVDRKEAEEEYNENRNNLIKSIR